MRTAARGVAVRGLLVGLAVGLAGLVGPASAGLAGSGLAGAGSAGLVGPASAGLAGSGLAGPGRAGGGPPTTPGALAAEVAGGLRIAVEPAAARVDLGERLDLTVTVDNTGTRPASAAVVHLDVTDPGQSGSVDPEDWTATLSKPVKALAPGESATLDWVVQPISGGAFAVYTVVLSAGSDTLSASNVATVEVVDRQSLNPNGILPVAVGVPAAIGALLLLRLRRTRRP